MASRDKPAGAEYGARRADLASSDRELQAPRESIVVLDSSLEKDMILQTQSQARWLGVDTRQPAFPVKE